MNSKFLSAGVAAAAVASALSMTATAAHADPTPAGTFRTYVAVGSDTTQDVWNGLTNGSPANITNVASYDAFPASSYIQVRSGGASWLRPSGSGNGVKFLSAAYDTTGSGAPYQWPTSTGSAAVPTTDVSFARSSSGPVAGASDDLTYIPFARDAVSLAIHTTSGLTGANLNTSQLTELYSGVNNTANDTAGYATVAISGSGATAVATINGVTVHPKIPQRDSGTRKFFLGAIGVTALAPYISDPATGGLDENTGVSIPNAGDVIPFSAAQWIAQVKGTQASTIGTPAPTGFALASINNLAPTSGSGTSTTPGPLFGTVDSSGLYNTVPVGGVGTFNRDTYNVVPSSFFGTGATAAQVTLRSKLTGTSTLNPGVTSTNAQATITSYGFGNLSYVSDSTKYLHGIFQH